MSRKVPEWIGKDDDTPFPPRVKIRIFERCQGQCCSCGLPIRGRLLPAYDHAVAIINGGENRESNGRLLCVPCHKLKTGEDTKEKSTVYRKKLKHLGIKRRKGKPLPGSRDSGWKKTFNHGWVRR